MGRSPQSEIKSVGDLRRLKVTVPQAADILDVNVRQVRKAIDQHVVTASYVRRGNRLIRTLDGPDVLCLQPRDSLKVNARGHLYARLKRTAQKTMLDIAADTDRPNGVDEQGTIKGTNVEAHRIAALVAGGMKVSEILEDYPDLNKSQINAAVIYARTHPKTGRPYPKRTSKSVLRNGGGGGLAAAFAAARED